MAPQEKLRIRISEIISRPKAVDCDEITWVMDQIGATGRRSRHGLLYALPGCKKLLMLNPHNNGKKYLPSYCVADFRDRMVELGLYELDESHDDN
jgi:hypothetical protein